MTVHTIAQIEKDSTQTFQEEVLGSLPVAYRHFFGKTGMFILRELPCGAR
jgi:hypothetical protein